MGDGCSVNGKGTETEEMAVEVWQIACGRGGDIGGGVEMNVVGKEDPKKARKRWEIKLDVGGRRWCV